MPKRTVHVTLRMTGTVDTTSIGADSLGKVGAAIESIGGTEDQVSSTGAMVLGNPAMALEILLTTLNIPGLINERVRSADLGPDLNGAWVEVRLVDAEDAGDS